MSARRDDPALDVGGVVSAWSRLWNHTQIGVIESKRQYQSMTKLMDRLIDEVGDDERHRLAGLLNIVAALIRQYEEQNIKLPNVSPKEVLRFLMEEHRLRQGDLKGELGSQGIVSEILNGKRQINARQAKALAARFGVSAAAFL